MKALNHLVISLILFWFKVSASDCSIIIDLWREFGKTIPNGISDPSYRNSRHCSQFHDNNVIGTFQTTGCFQAPYVLVNYCSFTISITQKF